MLKVSVVLDEQQQDELKMILADEDKEAALLFLKEVIWSQIQTTHRKEMRSHLEKGAV
jgi:dsDNA-binding SOS-regulon protein